MKIKAEIEITLERISDLLCSAIEGGSNYWYRIDEFIEPPQMTYRTDEAKVYRHLDYPLNEGGALLISAHAEDEDGDEVYGLKQWRLDLTTIEKGLTIMAEKYPRHWSDFVQENDDAETSDVFLQCALFGEIIFG
jgi:hypothetical protein